MNFFFFSTRANFFYFKRSDLRAYFSLFPLALEPTTLVCRAFFLFFSSFEHLILRQKSCFHLTYRTSDIVFASRKANVILSLVRSFAASFIRLSLANKLNLISSFEVIIQLKRQKTFLTIINLILKTYFKLIKHFSKLKFNFNQ